MPKSIRNQAAVVAKEYGFSSLQEVVRVLLRKLANREIDFVIIVKGPLGRLKPIRQLWKSLDEKE